jgi:hypothetical protein
VTLAVAVIVSALIISVSWPGWSRRPRILKQGAKVIEVAGDKPDHDRHKVVQRDRWAIDGLP